jgi:hypothetical protein
MYIRCQKFFLLPLPLNLSPAGGKGDKRKELLANTIEGRCENHAETRLARIVL